MFMDNGKQVETGQEKENLYHKIVTIVIIAHFLMRKHQSTWNGKRAQHATI